MTLETTNTAPEPAAPAVEETGSTSTVETPAAPATPVVEAEVKPEAKDNSPIIFDQAAVDKILGAERRKTRETISSLQKQVDDLLQKDYSTQLDRLAVGGIKRELLEKTGLKGDALEDFATDLAAGIQELAGNSAPSTIKFESAAAGVSPAGVQVNRGDKPASVEDAMASIQSSWGIKG